MWWRKISEMVGFGETPPPPQALLLSVYERMVGRASCEHLSSGDPLWYTTCALHALPSITKVHEYLPSASNDQTSRLETPCWAWASMHPLDQGSSPKLRLSLRYPGVGLKTRPGPIHPTPGMDVASLVCALASLSVWWRHGEWVPLHG